MEYLRCPCRRKGVLVNDPRTGRPFIICKRPICVGERLLSAIREISELKRELANQNDQDLGRAEMLLESAFGISQEDYTWAEETFTPSKKRCRSEHVNERREDINASPKKKSKRDFGPKDFLKAFKRCKITFDWSHDFTM